MKTSILLFLFPVALLAQLNSAQRFESIGYTDHAISLSVTSSVPTAFRNYYSLFPIETSADLVRWSPWKTLLATNKGTNLTLISDTNLSGVAARFYRTPTNSLITPLLSPGGPYAVGTTTRVFSDPSRSNRYNIKTNSSFVVQFWYPATRSAGAFPAPYLESSIAKIAADYYSQNGLSLNTALFTSAVSHAVRDLAIVPDRFPVVVFTHGYQCVRTMNTDLMVHLASQGYIAVAADHFDAWVSPFPGGLIVRGNSPNLPISVAQNILSLQSRTQDIRVMLDYFAQLQSADPFFSNALDLDHIGIFGHSLGGAIAADACAADSRLKAGLSLDGGAHTNLLGLRINQPFLVAAGDNSDGNSVMVPYRAAFRSLFDTLAHDAYWFRLSNAQHFDFVEQPWFLPSPNVRETRLALTLRAYISSFFGKYLKGIDDHLLDAPSKDYPDVMDFIAK